MTCRTTTTCSRPSPRSRTSSPARTACAGFTRTPLPLTGPTGNGRSRTGPDQPHRPDPAVHTPSRVTCHPATVMRAAAPTMSPGPASPRSIPARKTRTAGTRDRASLPVGYRGPPPTPPARRPCPRQTLYRPPSSLQMAPSAADPPHPAHHASRLRLAHTCKYQPTALRDGTSPGLT